MPRSRHAVRHHRRASAVYDGTGTIQKFFKPKSNYHFLTYNLTKPLTQLIYKPTNTLHSQRIRITMNTLQKALRPSSRRILAARIPTLATVPARWQSSSSNAPFDPVVKGELGVGELEGAKFKVEPLRRHGEDAETMRARLTCNAPLPHSHQED